MTPFLTNSTVPARKLQSAELVFDRCGKKEFLHEVLVPNDDSAELPISLAEQRAEKAAMNAVEQHALAVERHPLKRKNAKQQ